MLKLGNLVLCQRCLSEGWKISSWRLQTQIHLNNVMKNNRHTLSVKEINIPAAWGHIAGKWWGNPDVQPVFAIHGVQDNAATFNTLVPLLDVEAVLAIDLPGHGQSTHIPSGFPYHYMDAVCILRYMIKHHFKWSDPLVLLGHSFGSNLSFVYAALYPDQVSKYISLDCSRHHMSEDATTLIDSMRNTIDKMLSLEDKTDPPEYTEEELFDMFFKARRGPQGWTTKEGCKHLLSRGTSKLPSGKVFLSRDPKLKLNAFGRLTFESWLKLAEKITCDMLSIQAENGVVRSDSKGEFYQKTVNIILNNSPKSKHVILPGYHHVHLDNPKIVANEINNFLSS
ncbi:probable serine hydrolase [Macrosteles quadrilineatus]|uniref:probable serine hydrolase n=1 Tax=Macrosteles quadrilineatus TaxID=74068 RepID=UPI0023E1318B|nr:probable serine hydrolase [Macrosteles quadrilineatus]